MRGRAFLWVTLGEASLSFLQGEEITLRFKGGLRIFKNIIPVIMYKKRSGKIIIK